MNAPRERRGASAPSTADSGPQRMGEHHLDASGLLCPLPVIRTQDRIRHLAAGDELEVTATDPGTLHDIPAWCRVHGHRLLAAERRGDACRFRIAVCGGGETELAS